MNIPEESCGLGWRRAVRLFLIVAAGLMSGAGVSQAQESLPGGPDQADESFAPKLQPQAQRAPFTLVNGDNVLRVRGTLHFDGRHFPGESAPDGAETWILRRARPSIEGTLKGIYDFRFTPDFRRSTATINNASVGVRLKPWARITAGKFKIPVGLERSQSASDLRFIEHAFPTNLVPNLGTGVQLSGELSEGAIDYSVGYFNVQADGSGNDDAPDDGTDADGDIAARVFLEPFHGSGPEALHGLGFGVAGTYARMTGNDITTFLSAYRTPGQETFFRYRRASDDIAGTFADGARWRLTPQFHFYLRRLAVMGEYVKFSQDVTRATSTGATRSATLEHTAWQMQFAWMLTGENQVASGLTPASMFSPDHGTWGAFELAARMHTLDIDDAAFEGGADSFANPQSAPTKATSWGVAINWYLNQHVRWSLNHDVTRFEGGATGGDRPRERVASMRFGLQF